MITPTHAKLPSFSVVSKTLAAAESDIPAAYLHGLWCGLIVGGQYFSPKEWLSLAANDTEFWQTLAPEARQVFLQIAESTLLQLEAPDFTLTLLLPNDDESALESRVEALTEWCLGFIVGFDKKKQPLLLEGDAAQAFADLSKISEMQCDVEETEEDEQSYAELVEFVRVSVLMIHQMIEEKQPNTIITHPTGTTWH